MRRRTEKVRRLIEREPTLEPAYRRGLIDAFQWFLSGDELPFRVASDDTAGESNAALVTGRAVE